jgi:NADH-quinone oxidoreductase subunit N
LRFEMMLDLFAQMDWMTLVRLASPIILLLAVGVVVILGGALTRDGERAAPGIAITALCVAFVLSWHLWPTRSNSQISLFIFDRVSILGQMIAIFSATFTAIVSTSYFKSRGGVRSEYYGLIIFSAVGMAISVAAADLVMLLIGLETMSLATYVLVGYSGSGRTSTEASLKFFIMGAFATAFFIMGIAFLFGAAGTTDLGVLAARSTDIAMGDGRAFLLFGVAMVAIGFALKVGAIPFHAWLPDAYDGASLPVMSHMAVGFFVVSFIAFARFALAVSGSIGSLWHGLFWILALLSIIGGNLAALRQDSLKRMLAYSAIAHAGYLLILFPTLVGGGTLPLKGLIYALVAYSVGMIGAISVLMALDTGSDSPLDIGRLSGLSRRRPAIAAMLTLFMMSLSGLPPTIGFFGRYYLFMVAIKRGEVALVAIGVVGSLISVCCFMRPIMAMYLKRAEADRREVINPAVLALLALTTMATLIFGIFPEQLIAFVNACLM